MSETQILRACMDYLTIRKLLTFRMNTGAFKNSTGFYRFGTVGMADILTFGPKGNPIWLEIKTPTGKQSEVQKQFQALVEGYGHWYMIVRDVAELMRKL